MCSDLVGRRFGRLVVIGPAEKTKARQKTCLCQCDCGTIKVIRQDHLTSGATTSCGCYRREFSAAHGKKVLTKHGWYGTSLYKRWVGMRGRCNNPKSDMWKHYGGRGIRVCKEWNESFEAFRDWSLEHGYREDAPAGTCTLDRIDTNGNYEPDNCRWISIFEQQSNRRNNRLVEFMGERYTIAQLARMYDMCWETLSGRLKRGMSAEEAVSRPYKRVHQSQPVVRSDR